MLGVVSNPVDVAEENVEATLWWNKRADDQDE